MPDRWDAEAREIAAQIRYPGTFTDGTSREQISEWIAALARRAFREGLEQGAVIAENECSRVAGHPLGCDIAAAIRREIEGVDKQPESQANSPTP